MNFRFLPIFLLGWGLSSAASEVETRIQQLGAETFEAREAASRALWEMGQPALEAVRLAVGSADPEIRLRAQEVLPLLEAGIGPDWPKRLHQAALNFGELSDTDRGDLMDELTEQLQVRAIPFLLSKLGGEGSGHAMKCLQRLIIDHDAENEVIERLSPQPGSGDGALMLSAALSKSGREDAGLISLGLTALPAPRRQELLNEAVKKMIVLYREKEAQRLYEEAGAFAARVPDEARLLYLKGAGAAGLGWEEEAAACVQEALALHPDDESPHYQAATLLEEIGQDALAAKEWMRILAMPPEGDVYDINAYLRLGQINRRKGDLIRAANAFEQALKFFRTARENGKGVAMVGMDEEKLTLLIRELREQAERTSLGDNPLTGQIQVTVKDAQMEKLREQMKSTAVQMKMKVEPHGFRLLEEAPATLIFDREKKQIRLTLNGKPIGEGVPFELKADQNRAWVRMLDMRYLFELPPESGEAKLLERFELEYRFQVLPNEKTRQLQEPEMRFNGQPVTWAELAEGIPLDFLPEKIEFSLKGTDASGQKVNLGMTFDPQESEPEFP